MNIEKLKKLLMSATAKDTIIMFAGNLGSAFWGFLFTMIVARALSVSDFGVFSATLNLMIIITSLADLGISSGAVNFVAHHFARKEFDKVNQYIKASFIIRLFVAIILSFVVFVFSKTISVNLLATNDSTMAIWAGILPIFLFPDMLFPFILQAQKKFLQSTIYDNAFYMARLVFATIYYFVGGLTIHKAYLAFGAGFLINVLLTLIYFGVKFMKSKTTKDEYKDLIKFSGWIGVNRIISSVSGKLDVQMLAAMSGALVTGLYSIPSRLSSFIVVLSGSYSSVLATRMASFGDREQEKKYIIKSTYALIPISLLIVVWVIFAKPFMLLLFGVKYLEAVPVFQALALSQIPFLSTVPAVTAIIYAMKKTKYIGVLSFYQVTAIFLLNLYLIPKFGPYGPTITYAITNIILSVYVWSIVIRHYSKNTR